MPEPKPASDIKISLVRDTAQRKLQHITRGEQSIQECYLINKEEFFCGVRYEAGPFSFHWNAPDQHGSLKRGDLLIETVSLASDQEGRRAA